MTNHKIFICYRRKDSDQANRLKDRLVARYGDDAVFMDENLEGGDDWETELRQKVAASKALLMLVGDGWVGSFEDRRSRGKKDHVLAEIEQALQRSVPILNVLINATKPPDDAPLPETVKLVFRTQCFPLTRYHYGDDLEKITARLDELNPPSEPEPEPEPEPRSAASAILGALALVFAVAAAGLLASTYDAAHLVKTYDLADAFEPNADGELSNPSGPWTFKHGDRLLGELEAVNNTFVERPAFSANGLPVIFRRDRPDAQIDVSALGGNGLLDNIRPGDVAVHTRDDANGRGNGEATITWTSPADGVVSIAGWIWGARSWPEGEDRPSQWSLRHNVSLMSSGGFDSGPNRSDRSYPSDFSYASFEVGSGAFGEFPLARGDTLTLTIERDTRADGSLGAGDYVGLSWQVKMRPETSIALRPFGLGLSVLSLVTALLAVYLVFATKRRGDA